MAQEFFVHSKVLLAESNLDVDERLEEITEVDQSRPWNDSLKSTYGSDQFLAFVIVAVALDCLLVA